MLIIWCLFCVCCSSAWYG